MRSQNCILAKMEKHKKGYKNFVSAHTMQAIGLGGFNWYYVNCETKAFTETILKKQKACTDVTPIVSIPA